LWHSRDGGASWKPLKADFPTVPVYDVQFIKRSHDLVIATHGRGLFVLDNITALEELTPDVLASDFHVFSTLPAQIRVRPRHAGASRLHFEKPTGAEDEENPFRTVGGPRAIPGSYTVTVTAGGRTATQKVTVEPDPILGGDAARFAAQLRAGLEWRNAMSALNEMLNRITSLETQLKNTQQALRDNPAGETATAAPVARQ